MASALLAVIYLAFIGLGLPDSLLGAGWPVMHGYFGVPLARAGAVSAIISGGTIVSSLASDRLHRRLGTRYVTLFSVALTAAALCGFSLSTRFWQLCLWAVPYGLGAGSVDAALNNYVALHYSSRHMNWLHCFWGVGTIVSPYIMSCALLRRTWQQGYRFVALLQVFIVLVLLATLRLWNVHRRAEGTDAPPGRPLSLWETVRLPGAAPLLAGFFCYCAAESCCMLWSASFLTGARGVAGERAAAFAALFFIGITAGRLFAGFIAPGLGDRRMIRLGAALALLGTGLIALPFRSETAALSGLVVIGLGCAPVYPSVIHSTPSLMGAEHSQAVIGVQMAAAYLGSCLAPPAFGWLSARLGMESLGPFLGLIFAFMLLLLETARRRARPGPGNPAK